MTSPAIHPALANPVLQVVVGVADCRTARGPGPCLVTYALGSCIAVVVFDPDTLVGGMLHFMLPESSLDTGKAAANPFLFADTGVPILLQEVSRLGARKQKLRVCIAGGAQIMNEGSMFHIGKRNYLALRKILWKAGIMVQSEAIGGEVSRTVSLDLCSGAVTLRVPGEPESFLLAPNLRKSI
ncbi:MAG: CheD, stimulates methylation of protein [Bryobacterales bacterium]|nr:CheD, stimulates methylation of protein [Bryobacterales bacterium]